MKFKKMALLALMMTAGTLSAAGAGGIAEAGADGANATAKPATAAENSTSADGIAFLGASDLQERNINPAQSPNVNPFGLVYTGALTKNEPGKVNIHPVSYRLNGNLIAANIYTPAGYRKDDTKKYPAIIIAHPNGGVKEQVAGMYAQRLAENGYITITADASFQGASGGVPRNLDNPAFRVEDIHGMADIIPAFPGVDADRLGALGICGGGGYTLKTVQTDKRLKAVATLSMFNSGLVRRNGYMNSTPDAAIKNLETASAIRAAEAAGAEIHRTPGMETMEIPQEKLAEMPTLYSEGYIYYGKTHRHPNSTFQYTLRSNLDLFTFDAAANMELINQPLLMIAGSQADSLYMTEDAFAKATGTKNKELFLVEGATHIQTYWVPEYVEKIATKLTDFYGKNL
ncbi:alpha/beta hydrolase [Anaerovibrio sp.]|uniref:alpha/beta hydrolase n=1 Tax=Anaerovibrio sp. TaxID=1872532 RepID=UPI003F139D16